MNPLKTELSTLFLKAGELHITNKGKVVWTLLGSCVSVLLYNKRTKTSALCHAQLPQRRDNNRKCTDSCPAPCGISPQRCSFRYVPDAIDYMVNVLNTQGIKNNEIVASLYGGSNMIRGANSSIDPVGDLNVRSALKTLKTHNINVIHKDVGGFKGRNIYINPTTGEATVKLHTSVDIPSLVESSKALLD